jgi:hypothetical protein
MDTGSIETLAGAVVLLGVTGGVAAFAWRPLQRLFNKPVVEGDPTLPTQTLRLVPRPDQSWWQLESKDGKPAMQIVTRWQATNIATEPVLPFSGKLLVPKVTEWVPQSMVLTKDPDQDIHSQCAIMPGEMRELSVDFCVQPPFGTVGKPISIQMSFLDQYENEHRTAKLVLQCR